MQIQPCRSSTQGTVVLANAPAEKTKNEPKNPGSAIIGSDAGGIPELLDDSGEVYPRGDVKSLSKKIARLLDDPHLMEEMRAKAIERTTKHFILNRMVSDYLKLIERFLS